MCFVSIHSRLQEFLLLERCVLKFYCFTFSLQRTWQKVSRKLNVESFCDFLNHPYFCSDDFISVFRTSNTTRVAEKL